ncbi:MAG: PilC/PilY family type IV pilus protein [Myxococcota bacterium]|nr:PilC/PilY family type IV pilus protein [Myxococcota bacterium]
MRSTRLGTRSSLLPALMGMVAIAVLMPASATAQGDADLFTANVAPNVVLMVDNSGSMNHVVWHEAFDPAVDPTCAVYNNDATYYYSSTLSFSQCGNSRTLYPDPGIGGWTRISGRYLNWIFSDESDGYQADLGSLNNGTRSACLVDQGLSPTYSKYRRSRVSAAKEILQEVICAVNQAGSVRFGLASFYNNSDPEGGYIKVPVDDWSTSQEARIATFIDDLAADSWTPLAETLFNVYRYYQSRSNPAFGKDGVTEFPAYDIEEDGDVTTNLATTPPSPAQFTCQKNFVIIITDGEPTKDDFDGMDFTAFEDDLIGDYNPDNTLPEAGDETPTGCAYCNETSFYLDDIAKFMQENDFHRDLAGDQLIDVYTVGFTTGSAANAILEKTANVGNGLFFSSNNAEELSQAIVASVTDIIEKTQSFTSATVPASRTADGDNFYTSFFLPQANTGFWEGHLKNFGFTGDGDIVNKDGYCATGDSASDMPPCDSNGALRFFDEAYWDAADEIPDPSSRNLYMETADRSIFSQPIALTIPTGDEEEWADMFGLVEGVDDLDEPYASLPSTGKEDMVEALVDVARGCAWGSVPCTARVDESGDRIMLGDIFHSNPVVVGSPNAAVNDLSYRLFAEQKRERTRVIYAGANDGFLHAFHAGTWQEYELDAGGAPTTVPLAVPTHDRGTGEELFGFMPWAVVDTIKELPKSNTFPRTMETVDGSPIAADVWFYRTVNSGQLGAVDPDLTPDDTESLRWRTMLMGGLRGGGQSYYALDVSDPPDSAATATSIYPRYLWGFPCDPDECDNAVNGSTEDEADYMGFTWSEPVITRVRVKVNDGPNPHGYDRWVAIFGAGYHPHGDPNGSDYREPGDAGFEPKGRAIYMVDVTTGEVLAKKHFDESAPDLAYTHSPTVGLKEMRYAFASAPAVFDLDFDGYADVVYIGDLGGNLWKWVVSAQGDDPINNSGSDDDIAQPNWPFRLFMRAGTSLEPTLAPEQLGSSYDNTVHYQSLFFPPTGVLRKGDIYLAYGAGERANPQGPASLFNDGDTANNNHYYVVKDLDPFETATTPPGPIADAVVEADLADLADGNTFTCEQIDAKLGYFLTARDAEKFITNSVIFFGEVFTASFLPADPASSDPCQSKGAAYLYRFDLECAVGAFQTNPGGDDDKRRKEIGGGIPTRPRISVGDLDGGGGGGCANKVVVITSDGEIDSDCPGSISSSGVRLRSWRHR